MMDRVLLFDSNIDPSDRGMQIPIRRIAERERK
jgi:hypothetical protein